MKLPRIWIITDPEHPRGLIWPIAEALRVAPPATVGVQLRAKSASAYEQIKWAHKLRTITRDAGAALAINGRLDIAIACEAECVHLPEKGIDPQRVRNSAPTSMWIGASRHDEAGVERATKQPLDYIFLSPIRDVPGKNPALGMTGFITMLAACTKPVFALGGLQSHDISQLMHAGAAGVCVCRAVCRAEAPASALKNWIAELDTLSTP